MSAVKSATSSSSCATVYITTTLPPSSSSHPENRRILLRQGLNFPINFSSSFPNSAAVPSLPLPFYISPPASFRGGHILNGQMTLLILALSSPRQPVFLQIFHQRTPLRLRGRCYQGHQTDRASSCASRNRRRGPILGREARTLGAITA